jgi:hypothetical protein
MKKLTFAIVVLMLASPVWAGVSITAVNDANLVTIQYTNTEPNHVRAFALNVLCSNDVNIGIVDINENHYWVYPGSIDINATTGDVDANGTPVCYQTDYSQGTAAYDGTLPGPPGPNMTLELGSLYEGGPSSSNAPPTSGWLIKFHVNGETCVTLEENAIRGGVNVGDPNGAIVMEDPDEVVPITLSGCCVTLGCACRGDVTDSDKSGYVTGQDVLTIVSLLNSHGGRFWEIPDTSPYYDECADVTDSDKTGYITGQDVLTIVSWLNSDGGRFWEIQCPHAF